MRQISHLPSTPDAARSLTHHHPLPRPFVLHLLLLLCAKRLIFLYTVWSFLSFAPTKRWFAPGIRWFAAAKRWFAPTKRNDRAVIDLKSGHRLAAVSKKSRKKTDNRLLFLNTRPPANRGGLAHAAKADSACQKAAIRHGALHPKSAKGKNTRKPAAHCMKILYLRGKYVF